MFVFFKKLYDVRMLTKFARGVTLIFQMVLGVLISTQHADLFDRKKCAVAYSLHFVDV